MSFLKHTFRSSVVGIIGGIALLLSSCSSTSSLEPNEQLYIGLKPIDWQNFEPSSHKDATQEELEAALAIAPNGALFGSSYHRTPFPYGLWIWNACHNSNGVFKKWLNKSFGKQPVLMQNVNAPLRTSVAENILQNNGYFHGKVSYDVIEGKPKAIKKDSTLRAREARIQYHVNYGQLFTIDSVQYTNFPSDSYNRLSTSESLIKRGSPFSVSLLDNELTRIHDLFRNKGYYFYQKKYATFLADTIMVPGKVQMKVQLLDSIPEDAMRRWVIGSTTVSIKRQIFEQITDSVKRRYLTIKFGGEKPAVRPRVLLRQLRMRPGSIFSQDAYQESLNNLTSQGIYSNVDIKFEPKRNPDGTPVLVPDSIKPLRGEERAGAGILDMTINAILDKPYDFTFGANVIGKTNGRMGPGLTVGLTKRNAFRGGELLSFNIGANYEIQMSSNSTAGDSYDFSAGATLELPRLLMPNWMQKRRRRWYVTPTTAISLNAQTMRRAGFFTRNFFTGEFTYIFQPTECSVHTFTPLGLVYGRTTDRTDAFYEKMKQSAITEVANRDEFTPRMRYIYSYSSPRSYRNPVYWQTTVTEAGNLIDLGYHLLSDKDWAQKDKHILGTPFSQYLKLETDFRKTWQLGENACAVFHFYGGIMKPLGNDSSGPFSEQMYIGGANDLRGFAMRTVGPGAVHIDDSNSQYLYHNGDLKLVMNIEYRPRLFGSLYGALFLDAGNVWVIDKDRRNTMKEEFQQDSFKKDIALNVGVGLRYDLDFFVLRLDWGFALHQPYSNYYSVKDKQTYSTTSGFFNVRNFKDAQCINFAIGYPF